MPIRSASSLYTKIDYSVYRFMLLTTSLLSLVFFLKICGEKFFSMATVCQKKLEYSPII
jgi:hypothetical protein